MSIKQDIDEFDKIKLEIKNNNKRNLLLRNRCKELEKNIKEYLLSTDQIGLKYKGRSIILENQNKRQTKNKTQQKTDVVEILESLGFRDTEDIYSKILEAQKGDIVEKDTIKMKKIKTSKYY
jgi:hypothetical protein